MSVIYHSNQYETALEEGEREDENDIERERERERKRERKRERERDNHIYLLKPHLFSFLLY